MEKKIISLKDEFKEMNLFKNEKDILRILMSIADDDGWCYITIKSIANELNYSKTNVLVITKLLENKKIITQRIIGNRYTRTRFKLNLDLFNISSSSNNSAKQDTNCSNSSISDLIDIKVNDLMNEIEKLNKLSKLSIANYEEIEDAKFELKMIVSLKNNKTSSKQISEFKDNKIVFDVVSEN